MNGHYRIVKSSKDGVKSSAFLIESFSCICVQVVDHMILTNLRQKQVVDHVILTIDRQKQVVGRVILTIDQKKVF